MFLWKILVSQVGIGEHKSSKMAHVVLKCNKEDYLSFIKNICVLNLHRPPKNKSIRALYDTGFMLFKRITSSCTHLLPSLLHYSVLSYIQHLVLYFFCPPSFCPRSLTTSCIHISITLLLLPSLLDHFMHSHIYHSTPSALAPSPLHSFHTCSLSHLVLYFFCARSFTTPFIHTSIIPCLIVFFFFVKQEVVTHASLQ